VVCTRESASIEQIQELVRNGLDDVVERIDLSAFLDGVMDQLDTSLTATPSLPFWTVRFHLWRESWRFQQPDWVPEWTGSNVWTGLVGATAAIAVLLSILPLLPPSETAQTDTPTSVASAPKQTHMLDEPAFLVSAPTSRMDNQAQIESLTATTTVFLWNEPVSNTTVIWVGDSGGMP
jgi:hypothetical protein